MASSTGLLVMMLTTAFVLGTAASSYCGKHSQTHTIGPYYWTDVLFYPNATDFFIASINGTKNAVTFGGLSVFNDPLTSGPLTTDPLIGRAQGIFVQTDPDLLSGLSVFSFILPKGAITFNCYLEAALLVPNQLTRCGITSGNGGYRTIVKGYTEYAVYSTSLGGAQGIVTGTVTYCL